MTKGRSKAHAPTNTNQNCVNIVGLIHESTVNYELRITNYELYYQVFLLPFYSKYCFRRTVRHNHNVRCQLLRFLRMHYGLSWAPTPTIFAQSIPPVIARSVATKQSQKKRLPRGFTARNDKRTTNVYSVV